MGHTDAPPEPQCGYRSEVRRRIAFGLADIDPVALAFTSWWVALVAIWGVQQVHAGLHEHLELPPVLHLIRDASLAVPLAALAAVAATAILGPRALPRTAETRRPGLGNAHRLAWALLAAGIFALLSIPGSQIHGFLFGAEEEAIGWFLDAVLDASIAFSGAQAAFLAVAIVIGPPVRRTGHAAAPEITFAYPTDPPSVPTPRSIR